MKLEVPVQTCSGRATHGRSAGFAAAMALSVMSCGHFDFGAGSSSDASHPGDAPARVDAVEPGDAAIGGCAGAPGAALPTLVQHKQGFSLTSAADKVPLTVSLDPPFHPGDILILTGADTSGELTTPSAKGTSMWTRAAGTDTYNNSEIWYATIATSEFDGKVTISADRSGSGSPAMPAVRMILMEWSGLSGEQDPLHGTARSGLSQSQSPAPGAITTENPVDLILLDVAVDTSEFGMSPDGPSDWLLIDTIIGGTNATERAWYQITSMPGTFDPTVSITAAGSHQWDAALAGFKAAPQCAVERGSGELQ